MLCMLYMLYVYMYTGRKIFIYIHIVSFCFNEIIIWFNLDSVPMAQVGGMIMIQQNLLKLRLSNTLRTVQEILVDAVEEKRVGVPSGPQTPGGESWKLLVSVKLSNTR